MNPEPEALAAFHRWADNRRRQERRPIVPIVAFLVRLWLAWVLLQISSGASWLGRKAVPTAQPIRSRRRAPPVVERGLLKCY